ncbi:hypothetical protein MYX07_01955 [Patescibacteria group bacterium AH-259-L07]|nr:hypothetical protein [Patescibacteria group bacterium AH-259-L07]
MENIKIKKQNNTEIGWQFLVDVDGIEYEVILEREYWQKLTRNDIEPSVLIYKSFEFLLKREPKESILRKFNLKDISYYFPEYQQAISI